MQVRSWKGQPVITAFQGQLDSFHGHGFGQPVILSQRYETIANLHGGNHKIISIHEFNLLESGSALVEIYEPLQMDLSPYDDTGVSSWIVNAIVQGEILVLTKDLVKVQCVELTIKMEKSTWKQGIYFSNGAV